MTKNYASGGTFRWVIGLRITERSSLHYRALLVRSDIDNKINYLYINFSDANILGLSSVCSILYGLEDWLPDARNAIDGIHIQVCCLYF